MHRAADRSGAKSWLAATRTDIERLAQFVRGQATAVRPPLPLTPHREWDSAGCCLVWSADGLNLHLPPPPGRGGGPRVVGVEPNRPARPLPLSARFGVLTRSLGTLALALPGLLLRPGRIERKSLLRPFAIWASLVESERDRRAARKLIEQFQVKKVVVFGGQSFPERDVLVAPAFLRVGHRIEVVKLD